MITPLHRSEGLPPSLQRNSMQHDNELNQDLIDSEDSSDSGQSTLFKKLAPEKQEKVFEAAVSEFATQGYRNASMNNLVKTAGISKGSLFQYFRTKSDLFDKIVEIALSRVKQFLRKVRDDTQRLTFFQRLERMLRAGFSFIDEHPMLAKVYFQLLQSGEAPFGSERMIFLRQQANDFLAEIIEDGIGRKELREDLDVRRLAFLMNCILETLLRAYYTEFLASGIGLYRGNPENLDQWIYTTIEFIKAGVQGNCLGPDAEE
jgi:TetR/AcrR family transcriptional regulator